MLAGSQDLYCMTLVPAAGYDSARGRVELGRIPGPFTLTMTADGREVFSPIATIAGLPAVAHTTYVAWAGPPTMYPLQRLGVVTNGRTRLRPLGLDRFVVIITAEPGGRPVLRGQSPSSRIVPADFLQFAVGATKDTAMTMMPAPPGIAMLPGEMALRPAVEPMLPSGGSVSARPSEIVYLRAGDTLHLTGGVVRHPVGRDTLTMYAYNGEIPGPTIEVGQGDSIVVDFLNGLDQPSSIHWHGVRLDNRFDGVDPVAPGEHFIYHVRFPDAGVYWYHPHVREDMEQNLGLYGNIVVRSRAPRVHEERMMLGDLLLTDAGLVPYGKTAATHALMGRMGNVLLSNGSPAVHLTAKRGQSIRLLLTNVANSRVFNLSLPGARLKVIGSDAGLYEHEEWVSSVVIAPAERYIVQASFDRGGRIPIVNHVQGLDHLYGRFVPVADTLGMIDVLGASVDTLHDHPQADIARYRRFFDRAPDRTLLLTLETHDLPFVTQSLMRLDSAYFTPVEWAESMPNMNWASTTDQVRWVLRDPATGKENMDIGWAFARDTAIVLRLVNDRHTLHGMQHPIHIHGQRFLVLAVNGVPNHNLVWKDTALVPAGAVVDVLLELSNPGRWMLHCHIAEHLAAGMMTSFTVE
jgi:suppressor of ftsI